ncbi:unnamed protein product [Gadus morhua 'NCC']
MKKELPLYQAPEMQNVYDLLDMALRKGRQTCQLIYHSLGMCSPLPFERAHFLHPPATTLIINISNSTLVDCAIGNGNLPHEVVDRQPLMWGCAPNVHGDMMCSCFHGHHVAAEPTLLPPPATISVHSSQLNYVIIGDSNYMNVTQTH